MNGRGETRESIVRRAIDMPPGSPASSVTTDRAQRRLYETEAFRSVDVQLKPMTAERPAAAQARPEAVGAVPPEQPTRVVVTLEEAPLYRLRYGVQLTDDLTTATQISDLRVGVSAELRRRNLFGTALNAGIGGRIEPGNYSARAALNIPTSVLWPALSTLFLKESLSTEQGETGPVETIETSLTYQERWRIGQKSELSYRYDFTREILRFPLTDGIPDVEAGPPTHRANLFAALAWDHRDSVFNATRGWFHSSSLEVGAPAIGSDFSYVRYMFQQTAYRKVGPLVLAGAARTGVLVRLTGDDSETYSLRFRTGGDRTVRGYALDSLSAPGESGAMVGGRALLLLNGEVRFPVWRWLKAATFLDAGNAFVESGAPLNLRTQGRRRLRPPPRHALRPLPLRRRLPVPAALEQARGAVLLLDRAGVLVRSQCRIPFLVITAAPSSAAPRHRRGGALLVAIGIFISRIFGLVRVRVFSHYFGLESDAADAFNAAFRIPNLLQNLFGEGALSASFIPVYARLVDGGDEREADRVAGAVAGAARVHRRGHRAGRRRGGAVADRSDRARLRGREARTRGPHRAHPVSRRRPARDVGVVPRDSQQPPPVLPVLRRAGGVEPGA